VDHRGGWTEIFGGKVSEPETSRPVEKRNFEEIFLVIKQKSLCSSAALFA